MHWLSLTLLGAIVGVDATSFPQVMLSRPLVAGTLAGLLGGRPAEGLAIGALLEVFSLIILPIGASRYPESGTAAVAAAGGYLAAAGPQPEPALLVGAVLFGLGWERVGGATVVRLRRDNERRAARYIPRTAPAGRELERRHMQALALDLARAGVVTLAGGLIAYGLLLALRVAWGVPATTTLAALSVAGAALLGAALPLFGGWKERRLAFGFGLLCGLLLLALG